MHTGEATARVLRGITNTYTIWRKPGGCEFVFDPPSASDELYEALKEAYPVFRTNDQRVRQAIIDFCLREQKREKHGYDRSFALRSLDRRLHATAISSAAHFQQRSKLETPYDTLSVGLDSGKKLLPVFRGPSQVTLNPARHGRRKKALPSSPYTKPRIEPCVEHAKRKKRASDTFCKQKETSC
jgi:hypothetical protein